MKKNEGCINCWHGGAHDACRHPDHTRIVGYDPIFGKKKAFGDPMVLNKNNDCPKYITHPFNFLPPNITSAVFVAALLLYVIVYGIINTR